MASSGRSIRRLDVSAFGGFKIWVMLDTEVKAAQVQCCDLPS